ncbi:MAG TPA: type II CAAX endopeptidase family protein [Ktedonobacteraceae bacterium]|nr:type II CAAX endopeptidase family protein [Ktedonobacteraceae bacterium]
MKIHLLKMSEQQPTDYAFPEKARRASNTSAPSQKRRDQEDLNRRPSFFGRVPAIVWSGAMAFVLAVGTGGIWTVLLTSNLATSPAIPWSVAVMALFLWTMWQYLGGRWWPRSTSQARRRYLRARSLPGRVFAWAVAAGLLSTIALVGYWIVLLQVVKIPTRVLPNFFSYPPLTAILVLIMASLVSSLAEEASFRGYFLGTLEQRMSGPVAIVIAALLISPGHSLTQGFLWPIMLWYFFSDVTFGAMAYLTKSILPSALVHSIGLLIFFTLVWPYDAQRRQIWETGANTGFWIAAVSAIIFTVLALLAFIQLALVAKQRKP